MEKNYVYQTKLGENRRVSLPADLCREVGLEPGEVLLIRKGESGVTITSLRAQARRMQEEFAQMREPGSEPLTATLKRLRQQDAANETGDR